MVSIRSFTTILKSAQAYHQALGLRLQSSHQEAQLIHFHCKRVRVPLSAVPEYSILLQQSVALCCMDNGLLTVPLQSFEAGEEHARGQHETQVRLLRLAMLGLHEVRDGLVALL